MPRMAKPLLNLKLDRPLVVFDIESTGTSPRADRIIDIAAIRLWPDGTHTEHYFRLHPTIPIPPETTAIHGIGDADVRGFPTFAQEAEKIYKVFEGADLCGYNATRFDIPMLNEEFLRVGKKLPLETIKIVDPQRIYHRKEPRDLSAAMKFYCSELLLDAHSAMADVRATIRVFDSQLNRYKDLPGDVPGLDAYCNPIDPTWADRTGKLKWQNGEIVINFGKMKGRTLRDLIEFDSNFIKWLLRGDFPADTREIVKNATDGKWPAAPAGAPRPAASEAEE